MATIRLDQVTGGTSNFRKASPYLEVTYTTSSGQITITGIKGYRKYADSEGSKRLEHTITFPGGSGTFTATDAGFYTTPTAWKLGASSYTYNSTGGTGKMSITINSNFGGTAAAGATLTSSSNITIPGLPTYTVSYNANGGNSVPSAQTVTQGGGIYLAGAIARNNSNASGYLTISYNANGGTGAPTTTQRGEYVDTTSYSFNGWHEGSASGTNHAAGSAFTPTQNVTMVAGWNTNTYRSTNPTITLSSARPTRTNYTFLGWSANASVTEATYAPGGSYQFSANTTLYAVWRPNPPYNVRINFVSNTTTSINVSVAASGLPITKYVLYYRAGTSGNYISKDLGTRTTTDITGLSIDTNYQFYVAATNIGGTTNSSVMIYSTALTNPTITTPVVSNLLPFTCTITATGSITPSRTLSYRFSKDGGSTWTAYQSSNVYNWTGLNEETAYNMVAQVKATHIGNNAVDTTASKSTIITTPADQAKIRRMINGQWKKGKTYIMVNGQWVKAKKLYIMVNGQWKLNDNE